MGLRSSVAALWLLMLMATASLLLCSARNTVLIPGNEEWKAVEGGRSLLAVKVNDYGDPSANRGHDPPSTKKPAATSRSKKSRRKG